MEIRFYQVLLIRFIFSIQDSFYFFLLSRSNQHGVLLSVDHWNAPSWRYLGKPVSFSHSSVPSVPRLSPCIFNILIPTERLRVKSKFRNYKYFARFCHKQIILNFMAKLEHSSKLLIRINSQKLRGKYWNVPSSGTLDWDWDVRRCIWWLIRWTSVSCPNS